MKMSSTKIIHALHEVCSVCYARRITKNMRNVRTKFLIRDNIQLLLNRNDNSIICIFTDRKVGTHLCRTSKSEREVIGTR